MKIEADIWISKMTRWLCEFFHYEEIGNLLNGDHKPWDKIARRKEED